MTSSITITHLERIYVKIVFENNDFDYLIDVLSLPVLAAVMSSFDMIHHRHHHTNLQNRELHNSGHIRYERGLKFPDNLQDVDNQFELFEFAIERRRTRKRKYNTTTMNDEHLKNYQQKISWSIVKNTQMLFDTGFRYDRYCYTDGRMSTREIYGDSSSYMKIFSRDNKITHISNLNFRNMHNLHNHLIVYFDVAHYYHLKANNHIFKITFTKNGSSNNNDDNCKRKKWTDDDDEDEDDEEEDEKDEDNIYDINRLLCDEELLN